MKRTYNELYHIYSVEILLGKQRPEIVVVEDSNSSYEFFGKVCEENGITCISGEM